MPIGAPRPCTHSGCPELTTTGRCKAHKHDNWKAHQNGRTSTERGYGSAWRKKRRRILRRDKGLCQPCLEQGIYTAAREVDHIISKANGGSDLDNNLQSICVTCHRTKTSGEGKNEQHNS